jgi:L,D-peptidoglycan transpeptidase YkuD (ErfK/YbiS/YcfS/YnhG family)
MGWCDDPASGRYNRPIRAGAKAGHEQLWREDGVYDVVIPTSHNERPRVLGAGSAIFFHVAGPGYAPTEGCVAISLADLRRLLPRLSRNVRLVILP